MVFLKMTRKKVNLIVLIILLILAFFSGGLAYKYKLHKPITNLIKGEQKNAGFFYPYTGDYNSSPLFNLKNISYPFTFIVYGDSQEQSGPEKEYIIEKIINENPSFVVHVGDMVAAGDSHQWKIFDMFTGEILKKDIPFYPTLGNHEYAIRKKTKDKNPEEQLKNYFDRFKFLGERRWYSFIYGNSRFIFLDGYTNYSKGSKQYNWLINLLKNDSSKFLFINIHQPLHTKGLHQVREEEKFLAELLENYSNSGLNKPDIVFSGHNHNYERYIINNITYIVTGTSGGEPRKIIERSPEDLYKKIGYTYNYNRIIVYEDGLDFEMVLLNDSSITWKVDDAFSINK
jgi:predicted MPP superfamily phosphohydrolase